MYIGLARHRTLEVTPWEEDENARRLYTGGRVVVFSILDPSGPRALEAQLERRKSKARRSHCRRTVLKGLCTDLMRPTALDVAP